MQLRESRPYSRAYLLSGGGGEFLGRVQLEYVAYIILFIQNGPDIYWQFAWNIQFDIVRRFSPAAAVEESIFMSTIAPKFAAAADAASSSSGSAASWNT